MKLREIKGVSPLNSPQPLRRRSHPSYNTPPYEAPMPFSIRPFRRFPIHYSKRGNQQWHDYLQHEINKGVRPLKFRPETTEENPCGVAGDLGAGRDVEREGKSKGSDPLNSPPGPSSSSQTGRGWQHEVKEAVPLVLRRRVMRDGWRTM